jgi:hypothetical protein
VSATYTSGHPHSSSDLELELMLEDSGGAVHPSGKSHSIRFMVTQVS